MGLGEYEDDKKDAISDKISFEGKSERRHADSHWGGIYTRERMQVNWPGDQE